MGSHSSSILYCDDTIAVAVSNGKLTVVYYDPEQGVITGTWTQHHSLLDKADWAVIKNYDIIYNKSYKIELLVSAGSGSYRTLYNGSIFFDRERLPKLDVQELSQYNFNASSTPKEFMQILETCPRVLRFSWVDSTRTKGCALSVRVSKYAKRYTIPVAHDVTPAFHTRSRECTFWKHEKDSYWYIGVTYRKETHDINLYTINIRIDQNKPIITSIRKITCKGESLKEKIRIKTFAELRQQHTFFSRDSKGNLTRYRVLQQLQYGMNCGYQTISANNNAHMYRNFNVPVQTEEITPTKFLAKTFYLETRYTKTILSKSETYRFIEILFISPKTNIVAICFSGYAGFISLSNYSYFLNPQLKLDYGGNGFWNETVDGYYSLDRQDKIKCVSDPFKLNERKCIWLGLIDNTNLDINMCRIIFNFVDEYNIQDLKPWNMIDSNSKHILNKI